MIEQTFEPYFATVEMRVNTFLMDLDYLNISDFTNLENFQQQYRVKCSLVDLGGFWSDFMLLKLDCNSCGVNKSYFEEFYNWLVEKENTQKP